VQVRPLGGGGPAEGAALLRSQRGRGGRGGGIGRGRGRIRRRRGRDRRCRVPAAADRDAHRRDGRPAPQAPAPEAARPEPAPVRNTCHALPPSATGIRHRAGRIKPPSGTGHCEWAGIPGYFGGPTPPARVRAANHPRPGKTFVRSLSGRPSRVPNNLPLPLSSFVGRVRETAEISRLLGTTRLLTLTGTGGCGKTRLALQAAEDLRESYPAGIWLVELAPLADPALVPQAVAVALGVREAPGLPLSSSLADFLGDRTMLLVLDNCEHLIEAAAGLADGLLRNCPG